MNNRHMLVLLLLPVVVLAALMALHQYHRQSGTAWRVAIEGYDPRDLLAGHYLQFRYRWNLPEDGAANCNSEGCALCTQDATPYNPAVTLVSLAAVANCQSYIVGSLDYDDEFRISNSSYGLTRYYIPESEALLLQNLLSEPAETNSTQFSVGLRVSAAGHAYLDTLYINDTPLVEWLRAR